LREVKHLIYDSGQSVSFQVTVNDHYGFRRFTLGMVRGWRRELALRHLKIVEQEKWDAETVRAFVGIYALKAARDKEEALRYIDIVKHMEKLEIYFWSCVFLMNLKRGLRAWRVLYGEDTH
jgi:hypothetical protein